MARFAVPAKRPLTNVIVAGANRSSAAVIPLSTPQQAQAPTTSSAVYNGSFPALDQGAGGKEYLAQRHEPLSRSGRSPPVARNQSSGTALRLGPAAGVGLMSTNS